MDSSISRAIRANQYLWFYSNRWKIAKKSYWKYTSHCKLSRICSWIAYSSNSSAKILYLLWSICCYSSIEILHGENVENSSFDVTLMHDQLLVCLQLEKCSLFPKINKRVHCRSVSLFFDVYCICREAYFIDDVKSDNGCFMANCSSCGEWYHKKCMKIPVKVFRDEKY